MSNSTSSASTQETPSRSSAVKPLELHKPGDSFREQRLLEVAALSLRPEVLSALATVLQAELSSHLQAAALCNEEPIRLQHKGVVLWLQEFLAGITLARYAEQAHQKLALDEPEGVPEGGSDYMSSDGLGNEE